MYLSKRRKIKINTLVGLIYFKLCQANNEGIQIIINVSNNIPEIKLDTITIKELSRVMGILLDNAMDSAIETEEKSLSLYVYKEKENIIFQLSNTFKGRININLLNKKGYTTKGESHGYGLVIVKGILKRNKKITLNSEINNNVFTQYLKLNIN